MSICGHTCVVTPEEPKSLVEAFAEPAEAKGSDVVSLEIVSVQSSQQSAEQTSVSQGKPKILYVFHFQTKPSHKSTSWFLKKLSVDSMPNIETMGTIQCLVNIFHKRYSQLAEEAVSPKFSQ